MKTNKITFLILFLIGLSSCGQEKSSSENSTKSQTLQKNSKERQEGIIEKYLKNGAYKRGMYSQEWQEEIDKGLAQDSTIAYLWQ